jgi:hypothetical protein
MVNQVSAAGIRTDEQILELRNNQYRVAYVELVRGQTSCPLYHISINTEEAFEGAVLRASVCSKTPQLASTVRGLGRKDRTRFRKSRNSVGVATEASADDQFRCGGGPALKSSSRAAKVVAGPSRSKVRLLSHCHRFRKVPKQLLLASLDSPSFETKS